METGNILTHCAPEDVGIPCSGIEAFLERIENEKIELHSFMLMRHGRVAAEGWWAPYAAKLPHMLFSLSKSFTATAAGFAISEGLFRLDDLILDFFPEEAPKEPCENLKRMRVRDLLCMSTGHETEPKIFGEKNWEKAFFAAPVEHMPGTRFLYNTAATYIISCLITRTSGTGLIDYLTPRLFAPLGIETPQWDESPSGIAAGGFGLYLRTEDILRFGQTLLQEGEWRGTQVMPRHWVRLMTSWQADNSNTGKGNWAQGYGFQFWRCKNDAFRGDGMHGQFCLVMPKQDAVLAITAGTLNMPGVLDAVFETLLPAMGDKMLHPDPAATLKLNERINSLAIVAPINDGEYIAQELCGKCWKLPYKDENILLSLNQTGERVIASIQLTSNMTGGRKPRTAKLQFGLRESIMSTMSIMRRTHRAAARAGITREGGVHLMVQLVETPYRLEIQLKPDGSGVLCRVSVSPEDEPIENIDWTAASITEQE